MTTPQERNKEIFKKNLAALRKKSFEVKFDLQGTDYLPLENIGIGAYGVVCSAIHSKSKDRVAIKKIPRIFDVEKIAKRTYREIKILKHFKHDNIISIRELLKPKESIEEFKDIYVVFDLMESDLHKIIYSEQELSEEHARYFLYQLLRGLKYIHSSNVIHRDLKPSNLLVNEDCQLRIGDFGMARGNSSSPDDPNHFMTQYVATRWYRAPEIMLSLVEYGMGVDMWSVGCIFAEMLGRKHLFPGKDYISQIKLIVGVLGSPDQKLLKLCQSDIIKKFILQLGQKQAIAWTTLFPNASRKAVNLISKMLVLHPGERITVDDALKHPYLSKYHDPDDEPICVPAFNFDFENEVMDRNKLREVIWKEIMEYHEPRTPTLSFSACLRPVPNASSTHPPPSGEEGQPDTGQEIQTNDVQEGLQVVPSVEDSSEEPFKKPFDVNKSHSPVTVDTKKVETSDIEMHSAKTVDSKTDKGAEIKVKTQTDSKKGDNKYQETKMISSDTKALIKAALLNSNFKKRTESVGEVDEKPKPVTAAQRQREREEKRRKKKEKSLEKMKKQKEKKGVPEKASPTLSDADKELLQRWHSMQVPIAPKPATMGKNENVVINNQSLNITQTLDGKTGLNIVNLPQPGSLLSQSSLNQSQQSYHGNNMAVDNSNQMQMHLIGSGIQQTTTVTNEHQNHQNVSNNHQGQSSTSQFPVVSSCSQVTSGNQDSVSQLSTINVEGLDMLGLNSQQPSLQNSGTNNQFYNSNLNLPYMTSNVNTASFNISSTAVTGDNNSQDTNYVNQNYQRVMGDTAPSSHQSSPQRDYSNHSSPENYQQHGSPDSYPSLGSPDNSCDSTSNLQNYSDVANSPEQKRSPQPSYVQQLPDQHYGIGTNSGANIGNEQNFISGTVTSESHSTNNIFTGANHMQMPYAPVINNSDMSNFPNSSQLFRSSSNVPGIQLPFTTSARNISQNLPSTSHMMFQQQMNFSSQGDPNISRPMPSTSSQNLPYNPTNTQTDLISILSKQFSRSQVEDPCPPALALTPRGTGAGYGVGMDLDMLMVDAQDTDTSRVEPSPLSSSLLVDWMEVTGDLNIDLEALEQELQSPMTLSYSDLSLYPS